MKGRRNKLLSEFYKNQCVNGERSFDRIPYAILDGVNLKYSVLHLLKKDVVNHRLSKARFTQITGLSIA